MVEALKAPAGSDNGHIGIAESLITRRRITVDEYYRMAKAGILREDERVELIDGAIIQMAPIGSRHAGHINRFNRILIAAVGTRAIVSVQNPVHLSNFTEPQPDFLLLKPREDDYIDSHPEPGDVLLIIEVADSSLAYDRRVKLPFYARSGIPEAWVVNLRRPTIEVHWEPKDGRYQQTVTIDRTGGVTLVALPEVTIPVASILAGNRAKRA